MLTIPKKLAGRRKLATTLMLAVTVSASLAAPQAGLADEKDKLTGSYMVSISLDAGPKVAYPGLVSYDSEGYVVANEAVDFTGTPLAGATITEDHGSWTSLGHNQFLVTFVKLACINGKFVYTVTTRAKIQTSGQSFHGTFNLDIRDVNNQTVIPGGLSGSITGTLIQAQPVP